MTDIRSSGVNNNYKYFNPSSITETINVVGIKTKASNINSILKYFSSKLFKRTAIKSVQQAKDDKNYKIILLEPKLIPCTSKFYENISESEKEILTKLSSSEENGDKITIVNFEIKLDYNSFSAEDIISKLIPKNIKPVRSFEGIGHIAHLNLRDEHMPFKNIIGEVILAKNPSIKTVVTKVGNIKTKFRTFEMEIIAGEDNTETIVSEGGFKFKLDFKKVYWNSRLGTEHYTLATSFGCNDVICDMFAGIGPFAIPAVRKVGCTVYANDLNPESYHYLNINRNLNKIPNSKLHTFNLDGKEFIKHLISNNIYFSHVIMNLPASAYTFLDIFKGLYTSEFCNYNFNDTMEDIEIDDNKLITKNKQTNKKKTKKKPLIERKQNSEWKQLKNNLPWIHCYGFSAANDPLQDYLQLVEKSIGCSLPDAIVKEVRDVSPHKRMILASFPLPLSVALQTNKRKLQPFDIEKGKTKRQKLE